MRGVPRLREASSIAPSASMRMPMRAAERVMMRHSSSGVYSSSRNDTPKRSRSGAESCPARVVAPMSVKRGRSSRMELADGPLPTMMSMAKSSMAG